MLVSCFFSVNGLSTFVDCQTHVDVVFAVLVLHLLPEVESDHRGRQATTDQAAATKPESGRKHDSREGWWPRMPLRSRRDVPSGSMIVL